MDIKTLAKSHKWNMPTVCPVCGGELSLSENHKHLLCTNEFCSSRNTGRINKWTNTLDIKGFGMTTIETLHELGFVDTISSLYTLDTDGIAKTEGFGKRSAELMVSEINAHKEMTLAEFIAGYNIEGIGLKVIENVIRFYKIEKFEDFFTSDSSQRFVCDGVGSIISKKLAKGLSELKEDMEKTLNYVSIVNETKTLVNGVLGGKSYCFTGAASLPRKELQQMVVDNGGVVFDSVKKGLDFLVMADPNSNSSKAVKARQNGVSLLSESDFLKLCGK